MNDVNALVEELRTLISTSEFSAAERFRVAMNRMAGFLADAFGLDTAEVAVLWKRGKSLAFLWPDYLAEAREVAIRSKSAVAATIFRGGRQFLDNRLMEREHLVEYEFVKEADGEARRIWKMMGVAVTVDGERRGVVQVSRKRSAFGEPGPDFTPADLELLEKLVARLGPFIQAVAPF
ncbi:MAG: hypothetical protein JXO51_08465 [Candidatus Aminicenantes bacterium]|nr:hypothetical protein [Candidatus Aminicenantes bacterium]